jgi:hypothetical protein
MSFYLKADLEFDMQGIRRGVESSVVSSVTILFSLLPFHNTCKLRNKNVDIKFSAHNEYIAHGVLYNLYFLLLEEKYYHLLWSNTNYLKAK